MIKHAILDFKYKSLQSAKLKSVEVYAFIFRDLQFIHVSSG